MRPSVTHRHQFSDGPEPKPQSITLPSQQLGAEIGRGGFGAVFTALSMNTGDLVAVKRLELTDVDPGPL